MNSSPLLEMHAKQMKLKKEVLIFWFFSILEKQSENLGSIPSTCSNAMVVRISPGWDRNRWERGRRGIGKRGRNVFLGELVHSAATPNQAGDAQQFVCIFIY